VYVALICHFLSKWLEAHKPLNQLESKKSSEKSAFTTGFTFFSQEKQTLGRKR
jgi:hypothetical protein